MNHEMVKEYILGKQTLAELNVCPFGNSQVTPVELITDDQSLGYLRKPAIINLIGGVILLGTQTTRAYAEPFFFGECGNSFIAVSRNQSDSQQVSQREQRARDAKFINTEAKEHVARVFAFEKPFMPEETSTPAQVRDVSRVLKLRKR
jgi:hypothetical protein